MTAGRLYMDRRLAPARALSPRALALLLAGLLAANLLIMGFLLLIGAYPVPLFLGLDFLAVWLAFRVSNARATRGERVRVSAEEVRVEREGAQGARALVWASPTAFTTVAVARAPRGVRVQLRMSGRALTVGASLGAAAQPAFARELEAAVAAARAERW